MPLEMTLIELDAWMTEMGRLQTGRFRAADSGKRTFVQSASWVLRPDPIVPSAGRPAASPKPSFCLL